MGLSYRQRLSAWVAKGHGREVQELKGWATLGESTYYYRTWDRLAHLGQLKKLAEVRTLSMMEYVKFSLRPPKSVLDDGLGDNGPFDDDY